MPVHLRGVQRLPVRLPAGQRLRELPEPETRFTGRHRAPEREPARLLHGVLRLADHQTTGTWKTLGGRVPETLRHIQVVLRQTPQRRLRQRCHKGESELPQGHRQGH